MNKIISGLILTLLLSSCVTRRACERRFPVERADSISSSTNTVTVIKDTTIFIRIPGDTLAAKGLLTDVSQLSTSLATSSVYVKDGIINHRLEQMDTVIGATIKGALKSSSTLEKNEHTILQTRYINQLTGWQWTQVYLGRILLGMVGVWILLKLGVQSLRRST